MDNKEIVIDFMGVYQIDAPENKESQKMGSNNNPDFFNIPGIYIIRTPTAFSRRKNAIRLIII
ncbi:MAG: hypothetical protein IJM90_01605 [Firmicutes bacterium]|nr:hypothetical protein [Bacillota bacterium]